MKMKMKMKTLYSDKQVLGNSSTNADGVWPEIREI